MHTTDYVINLVSDLKAQGAVLSDVAWQAALACVVFVFVGLCAVADEDAERRHK